MDLANELMSYRMGQCFPLSLSTDNIAAADISDTKVCALVLLKNHQLEKMDARGHFKDIRITVQRKSQERRDQAITEGKC